MAELAEEYGLSIPTVRHRLHARHVAGDIVERRIEKRPGEFDQVLRPIPVYRVRKG